MTDMTPLGGRLTAKRAQAMLEEAGARKVCVIGRGQRLLAFFETNRKRQAWIIQSDGWVGNFAQDVAREFS